MGWRPAADRSRVGGRCGERRTGWREPARRTRSDRTARQFRPVRRWLDLDGERVPALPRLPRCRGCGRRVQRQVHVGPDGAAGRFVRHCPRAQPRVVPQLLLPAATLAVHRGCGWRRICNDAATRTAPERSWRFRHGSADGLGATAQDDPGALFLRSDRLRAVRGDHATPGILSDTHRGRAAVRARRRHRRGRRTGRASWSNSARDRR